MASNVGGAVDHVAFAATDWPAVRARLEVLAIAYHDARDTPRARKAMQRAIALREGRSPAEA